MPKITLDGVDYHTEDLSAKGILELKSLQFLEKQMDQINKEIEIYSVVEKYFVDELKRAIDLRKNNSQPETAA